MLLKYMIKGEKMFSLQDFYEKCFTGEKVDCREIFTYIRKFKYIILRGAAAQGVALGKKLEKEGISVTVYWDVRADELVSINGTEVEMPFAREYERQETVIIHAIPNHVIMARLIGEMRNHGYENIIRGDVLYSAAICEYQLGDKLSAKRCWQNGGECRSVVCQKANNIVKNYIKKNKGGARIDLTYCCFIINSICNLSCRDCVQYMPNYPANAKGNVPFEIISRDIDIFFDMVDSVGTVSVMGGETFMHPDVARIACKFAEKDNIGFVSFPTNGLYPIKPEQLDGIKDDRIIIAFGYYLHRATEQQKEIYYRNIELVKKFGIAYTESLLLPSWIETCKLNKRDVNEKYMTEMKQGCTLPARNLQVKNGKIHICDKGVAIYNMGLADYPTDYLDLTQNVSGEELREAFRLFDNRPFYYSCGHCEKVSASVESAIQGCKEIL
ncbi:MAG: hypothetical protein HFH84_19225 [Lachnospiraceae bacterium]|nr:hypothetical protein [Lachnospiraceae bacterium]